ncbi:MAG: pcrA [Myxococcaceae bacterium]|nr:pcrA [Myxococcaceae bacterium]
MTTPLAELNAPQAEAVAHVRGPILVFAGAGSGKTRVITYRVANLVATERIPPYRILAVTFTNKAAGEMRARLDGLLGHDIAKDLWVGTFHATCAKLLRRYGEAVGLPKSFIIYDTQDQKAVVNRVLRELDLDERRYPPRAALAKIHSEKQEGRGPADMAIDSYVDEKMVKIFEAYEAHLQSAGAVDFEDLIGRMVKLVEDPNIPEGNAIRRRFEFVLVDEFQDTNSMQYRLLRALARDHKNLCVVGDDDQSIYRWRGADVRNIRGFKKDFPDAVVVKLEQNYRSSARIVKAALGVIAPSRDREPKELWTANDEGLPIDVVATRDEHDEAAFVTRAITDARAAGTSLEHIAVFYRVHAQSRVLEEGLRMANLPYQIVGGTKFYERAEIKDALSYLRVLVNPRSDVDFLRIVNSPARGIGQTTILRLTAFAHARKIPVHDALSFVTECSEIAAAAQKKLAGVRELLAKLRREAEHAPPSTVLLDVLDATGYREALRSENNAESDARLENLAELVGSIRDFELEAQAAGESATLDGFLERVSLQADVDQMKNEPKVTLMTVHGAKGLEFDLVLLTGMEEDMFPYQKMDGSQGPEEMEEERRLAYVAVTRARKKLVLTHAGTRQIFGNTRWGRPSRFLSDLPPDAIEVKQTRAAGTAPVPFIDRPPTMTRELQPMPWKTNRPSSPPPARARAAPPSSSPSPWGEMPIRPLSSRTPPASPPREAGERYVDNDYFDDAPVDNDEPVRRGSRVFHERFGEGEVLNVIAAADPMIVAFFPGWGEKKVLARFLRRG